MKPLSAAVPVTDDIESDVTYDRTDLEVGELTTQEVEWDESEWKEIDWRKYLRAADAKLKRDTA